MANFKLQADIEAAPDNKTRLIIKETAAFVGEVVDKLPTGKIGWVWVFANIGTIYDIAKTVIVFVNRIKQIINE